MDFQRVFREQSAGVWRLLRGMGLDDAQVEDCSQEVFLIAYQKLAEFEHRSKLSTWIYSIAYRVGANHRRKLKRRGMPLDIEGIELCARSGPEQEFLELELAETIFHYYAYLNEGMRDVFLLCFLEECTLRETAEILEISINTVSSRVRLLRAALLELLETKDRVRLHG